MERIEGAGYSIEYNVWHEDGQKYLALKVEVQGNLNNTLSNEKILLGKEGIPFDEMVLIRLIEGDLKARSNVGRFENVEFRIYNSHFGTLNPPDEDAEFVASGLLKKDRDRSVFTAEESFNASQREHFFVVIDDIQSIRLALYPTNAPGIFMGACMVGDIKFSGRVTKTEKIDQFRYEIFVS